MGERLAYSIDPVDARVADIRMPAMILLPLIDHAIAQGPTKWHADGSLRIRATAEDDGLRLEILGGAIDLTVGAEGASITGVRERLASLYGRRAALVLEPRAVGDSVATLQIPLE